MSNPSGACTVGSVGPAVFWSNIGSISPVLQLKESLLFGNGVRQPHVDISMQAGKLHFPTRKETGSLLILKHSYVAFWLM